MAASGLGCLANLSRACVAASVLRLARVLINAVASPGTAAVEANSSMRGINLTSFAVISGRGG